MKKVVKITAALLLLVMTISMAGCTLTNQNADTTSEIAKFTVGVPFTADSPNWAALVQMLENEDDGFEFFNNADVTLVTVPEVGTEEYTKFISDVRKNKIDMFLAPPSDEIDQLISEEILATNIAIENKDERTNESTIPENTRLAVSDTRIAYGIPFVGSYQGLFINTEIFEDTQTPIPTDWQSFLAAIENIKEFNRIVPVAAGFADGAKYLLDEMILSEGGIAEHSTPPSKGVISSWERAINRIKSLYDNGAFGKDAVTKTHDVAVAEFANGTAAMIVCSSTDLAGKIAEDKVKFISFPVTDTGLKTPGTYIGESALTFHITAKALAKSVDDTTSLSGVMAEFIFAYCSEDPNYTDLFSAEGTFPFKMTGSDCMDSGVETDAWNVITKAPANDLPMEYFLLAFDELESGLADVLSGATSTTDYLTTCAEAERAAQNEKKIDKK